MPKNIRVKTKIGVDRNLKVKIDQDFDFLEILSLKLRQEDVYNRFCADYGVVTGRVVANGGFGVPNANVSVFVPIDSIDENDPVISTLYPYRTPNDKNEDGYRYNLLPYEKENFSHTPTGTFPSRNDVLTRKEVLHIYEKYYKYTVKTNNSGDFMIVGVPLGQQKVVLDLDLSNIGQFSLRPPDLIRMGKAVQTQFDGQFFKASENLDSLPQIVHDVVDIDVSSFWGDDETCDVGITRVDFDLRELGYEIVPTAIFMGSMFSTDDSDFLKKNCKPKPNTGNLCDLITSPGQILCIRQTIDLDENGDPVLEQYNLENNGNLIDDAGTWLIDLPMNLDYLTTNEFGETIISNDSSVGIPSKAKYRFKIKWQSDGGLQKPILRANYLIPNVREHWTNTFSRPQDEFTNKSYAFSLDWNDYYDKDAAILCEDSFYKFSYNKVYTVSSHIDRFKWGINRARHLGIKEIDDRTCQGSINKLPVNDGVRNFDFLFFVFNIMIRLVTPMVIVIICVNHVLAWLYPIFIKISNLITGFMNKVRRFICKIKQKKMGILNYPFRNLAPDLDCEDPEVDLRDEDDNPFMGLKLPMIIYPDCEACNCNITPLPQDPNAYPNLNTALANVRNVSTLSDFNEISAYSGFTCGSLEPGEYIDESTLPLLLYDPLTDEQNDERMMAFAGNTIINDVPPAPNLGREAAYARWYGSPVFPSEQFGWAPNLEGDGIEYCAYRIISWRCAKNPTYPQHLNLMNQRARYFKNNSGMQNIVQGEMINDQFDSGSSGGGVALGGGGGSVSTSPNDKWTDQVLILVVDPDTNFNAGQLLSFQDPKDETYVDRNLNYYPEGNQFLRFGRTATTVYNETSLFTRTFNFIDEDGIEQTANVQFFNTASTTDYKFTAGIEYFQVLTGYTLQEVQTMLNASYINQTTSLLYNYIFNYEQKVMCTGGNAMPPEYQPPVCGENANTVMNSLLSYYEVNSTIGIKYPNFLDQKVYFLTRGVDVHSPRQKIKYNLSRLFFYQSSVGSINYGFNTSNQQTPFIIEGDFYMNMPIQKHVIDNPQVNDVVDYFSPVAHYTFNYNVGPQRFDTNNVAAGGGADIEIAANSGAAGHSLFFKPFIIDDEMSLLTTNPDTGSLDPLVTTGFTNYSSLGYQMADKINQNFSTYDNEGITIDGYTALLGVTYNSPLPVSDPNGLNNRLIGLQGYGFPGSHNWYKRVEGASLQFSKSTINNASQPFGHMQKRSDCGTIAGTYFYNDYTPHTAMYNLRFFRSDRLPVSDSITIPNDGTTRYDQRLPLYMNPGFRVYLISDIGQITAETGGAQGTVQNESTGNLGDMADELPPVLNALTESFTCSGMVALSCYQGNGEDFTIEDPCIAPVINLAGADFGLADFGLRVENGCYVFVLPAFIASIPIDLYMLFEYRARIILNFAICRGVLSHVFQNNWLNGSLYLPSFQKRDVYNVNEVSDYDYCGRYGANDGPLYFNTDTNSFFYRSTPYYDGNFIGQTPSQSWAGANKRNIWFPTTIMDLGPRESFLKDVIFSPEFESYLLDKIESTSYQEVSDIINLFLLSRLVSANFIELMRSSGDASVKGLFSRDESGLFNEDRVDGDLAQLFSINSEFGVIPYIGGNYVDSVTVQEDRLGIWFQSELINRKVLNPGITTFGTDPSTSPTNYFGYPGSQLVPYYRWEIKEGGLFGTELNSWYTDEIFTANYQSSPLSSSGYVVPQSGPSYGYIFNASPNDPELDELPPGNNYKVGNPYQFYFGLEVGKSALNRFISQYLFEGIV